jgi:hypothetical protein
MRCYSCPPSPPLFGVHRRLVDHDDVETGQLGLVLPE